MIFYDRTQGLNYFRFFTFLLVSFFAQLLRGSEVFNVIALHRFVLNLKVQKKVNIKVNASLLFCYHDL